MKRVRDLVDEIYGVREAQRTFGLVVIAKDERTRKWLESLNQQEQEKAMKLIYYKVRNGKIVDQIWRGA